MRMQAAIGAGLIVQALAGGATFSQATAHLQQDTLAEVGGQPITARDLIERMEMMPWPGKEKIGDRDSAKIRALQSLVGERILAMEATSRGFGDDSVTRAHEKNLENLLVRDELYKQETRGKSSVSQSEVHEGLVRFASQRRILMLATRKREGAEHLARLLRSSANRDSAMAAFRGAFPLTIDTVAVNFGLLEKPQEDVVYALTPGAPVSAPVELRHIGWGVLVLIGRETNPEYASLSILDRAQAVTRKIHKRKELVVAGRAAAKILASQRAEAREDKFDLLERTMHRLLADDSLSLRTDRGYRLDMVVGRAESDLGSHVRDVLVDMPGGGMTIGDVLESFRAAELIVPTLDRQDFRQRLNAGVKEMVEREFLSREGYRRGLEHSEEVKHDVGTWSNYWRAQEMSGHLLQGVGVGDEDIVEYLVTHPDIIGSGYRVNIREILSDSLRQAVHVMEEINQGKKMKDLARAYSRRKSWAERGGESGLFAVNVLPEIGVRALFADSGSLVGPVKCANGYSVFTVLGKVRLGRDTKLAIDSMKTAVKGELLYEKEHGTLNAFVASVARDYRVTMYYNRLKNVAVSPVNIVTRRFIGFGGSILAVPALNPLWEWVGESNAVREIFP